MRGYKSFSLLLIFLISLGIAFSQKERFQEGERYFQEKSYNKAIAIFKEILDRLEWDEFSFQSALRLGQCYSALGDYENARRFFNVAKKGEGDVKWEAMIGIGISYMGEKNFDSAIDAFSDVISQFKTDRAFAYAYYNRGLAYKGKGWIVKALDDFSKAKTKAKGEEELLKAIESELSECRSKYEEFKSAENSYLLRIQDAQARGDMDGCANLLRELARLCEDKGDMDGAIGYERQAIDYSTLEEFKAQSLMNIAWRYFKLKDYEKAAEAFKEVIDEYPKSAQAREAFLRYGDMQGYMGKQDEAIKVFTAYLEMYPNDPEVASVKMKIAWCYYNKGDYEKSAEAFKRVVMEHPDSGEAKKALIEMGNSYAKAGKNEEAIKAFQTFIEKYPQDERIPEAMMNLAWRYRAKGDIEKMEAVLKELNRRFPNSELGWFAMGLMKETEGMKDPKKAEEGIEAYLKAASFYGSQREVALLGVVNCAYLAGQYKTAIQYIDRLLEEYPNIYDDAIREAEYLKGRCYIALKEDTSKIVSYFRKLMEKYPDTEFGRGAWVQIVYAYLMGGKMEQAQEEEEKIINQYKDTHPEFVAQTLSEWGDFFYGKGEYEEAIKKYFEAMKMNPKLTQELRIQISSCFELMGDYENAIKYLEVLLEEMDKGGKTGLKDVGWILWKLMRNYEHKFDFQSAINAYHRFKSLMSTDDPMAELTKFRLGYCYLQVGDCEKACKVWQEIVEETSKDYYLHDVAERVLRNYRDEPPYLPSLPSFGKEKKARIIGAINSQLSEAFNDFHNGKVLIIYGGRRADEEAGTNFKNFNKDKFGYNLPCKKDTEVSEGELKENNLVLFGTPTSNKVMRALSDYLPIKIGEKRIEVGSKSYDGEKAGVIMLIPNPFNEEKFVLIYSSYNPKLQVEAQSVFHGPTDYVIFSEEPEKKNLSILEEGFFYKRSGRRWEIFPRKRAINRGNSKTSLSTIHLSFIFLGMGMLIKRKSLFHSFL